jgi:2-polyprenyl-6-methoxyphenol hydroxylase-like FAD-dependent oxidoreductase
VTVVERAPSLDPVGAGLGVGPNALHALDALGLGDALRARAAIQGDAGIRRPDGRGSTARPTPPSGSGSATRWSSCCDRTSWTS